MIKLTKCNEREKYSEIFQASERRRHWLRAKPAGSRKKFTRERRAEMEVGTDDGAVIAS